jgi:hypothetical protein
MSYSWWRSFGLFIAMLLLIISALLNSWRPLFIASVSVLSLVLASDLTFRRRGS